MAGSRNITDVNYIFCRLDIVIDFLSSTWREEITIVSGMARGVDTIAVLYGEARGYKINKYPADWAKFPRSAGYIRNLQMVDASNVLVLFWDGTSRGTKHTLDTWRKTPKPYFLYTLPQ